MKRSVICLVLVLVTVGLPVLPAAAASPAVITDFSVTFRTNASVPVVGDPVRYFSSAMAVNDTRLALTGDSVLWKDENGVILNDSDRETGLYFEAGRTYYTTMVAEVLDPGRYTLTKDTAVTVTNVGDFRCTAKIGNVYNITANRLYADIVLAVTMKGQRTYPDIKRVVFLDAPNPVDGSSYLVATADLYPNNCEKTSDTWYHQNDPASVLEAGETYTREIVLTAKSGYKFDQNAAIVLTHVNEPKTPDSKVLSADKRVLTLRYSYTIPGIAKVKKADVQLQRTNLALTPCAGDYAMPLYSGAFKAPGGSPYGVIVSTNSWYTASGKKMTETDTFALGQTYYFDLPLQINDSYKDTYCFAEDLTSAISGAAYTGKGFLRAERVDNGSDDTYALMRYYFVCQEDAKLEISAVDISVYAPSVGNEADAYVENMPEGCRVESVAWYENGTLKSGSFTFQPGSTYRVAVTLVADELHKFASSLTKAAINGKNATVTAYNGDRTRGIKLTVTFAALPYIIDQVVVAVLDPVAGEYPPAPTVSTDYTSVYAYEWYLGDERLSSFETLEAGKTYTMKARVTTLKVFSPDVTVRISNAYTQVLAVEYDNTHVLFEAVFTVDAGGMQGDMDGDGDKDTDDAVYLLLHVMFGNGDYPITNSDRDMNNDGKVDTDDAVYLLLHVMFGAGDYPI